MTNSHWMSQQLAAARARLDSARQQSETDELGDFFVTPLLAHTEDLEHKLMLSRARENSEIIECRLFGESVDNGTIRLSTLAKLAGPLNDWIASAAHRIRYGSDKKKGVGVDITNELDIRLAKVGSGSTRLFITGNSRGDLTGETLLATTLEILFALLNHDEDEFYDDLNSIGLKSAHKLEQFIDALREEAISVELKWDVPGRERYRWDGRIDEIKRVKHLLSGTNQIERETKRIQGVIALLSDTRRLELHSIDKEKKIKVSYGTEQFGIVSDLKLGSSVELSVESIRRLDPVRDEYIEKFSLVEVLAVNGVLVSDS